MSIPQIPSGIIPQLLEEFSNQLTWEMSSSTLNLLEAAFYGSLQGDGLKGRRFVNWIHETSVGYISEIQTLFNLANFCFLAFSGKKTYESIKNEYDFSILTDIPWPSVLAVGSLAIGQLLAKEIAALNGVRNRHNTNSQEIIISERVSYPQRIAATLHATQLAANIILAYLGEHRFSTTVSLAATSYSYWKNSQLGWISFTRCFNRTSQSYPIKKIKATYHMLALSPNEKSDGERCAVCLEDDSEEMISFCANHSIHKLCITELVKQKTDQFCQFDQIQKFSFTHFLNAFHTYTTLHYEISIDQNNLPACPQCRSVPIQNSLEMSITDAIHGDLGSGVTIKRPFVDRQYLYENINALYCTTSATIACLQTYPELITTMYKIQKMMIVTDLIFYAGTMHYLSRQINAKHNPTNSTVFKISTLASMALIAVTSWYVLLQIQHLLQPKIDLNASASEINLEEEDLKTLDLSFKAPWCYTLIQTLLVNRMIGSIALSFFSKKQETNILSAAMMVATLGEISSFSWIKVIQRLDQRLLFKAVEEQSWKESTLLRVKSCETTHYFVADRFSLSHLKQTLKSITTFTSNFFKKSRWENYLEIVYTNGVETSKKQSYTINLWKALQKPRGYSFESNLAETTIRIVDILRGEADVAIHKS